ncbi:hypothetical protein JCM10296v2_006317 [Rhodotorula toruloides]
MPSLDTLQRELRLEIWKSIPAHELPLLRAISRSIYHGIDDYLTEIATKFDSTAPADNAEAPRQLHPLLHTLDFINDDLDNGGTLIKALKKCPFASHLAWQPLTDTIFFGFEGDACLALKQAGDLSVVNAAQLLAREVKSCLERHAGCSVVRWQGFIPLQYGQLPGSNRKAWHTFARPFCEDVVDAAGAGDLQVPHFQPSSDAANYTQVDEEEDSLELMRRRIRWRSPPSPPSSQECG